MNPILGVVLIIACVAIITALVVTDYKIRKMRRP